MAVDEAFLFLRNNRYDTFLDRAESDTEVGTSCSQRDFVNKLMDIPEVDRCRLFLREFEGHSISYLTEVTGLPENT